MSKIPIKPELFICKPDRTIIGKLKEAFNINHKLKLAGTLNELTFSLPYEIDINHKLTYNPHIDLIKYKYLIKLKQDTYEEWFIIDKPTDNIEEDSDYKKVDCFSLQAELKYIKLRNYNIVSYNIEQIINDILTDTLWTVDYITPSILGIYRSFNVNSKSILDFILNDIITTFNVIPIFDTINRKISFYKEIEIGIDRGLSFNYNHYLKTLNKEISTEKFCTKLKCYGKNNLTIREVNPTSQDYLFDYSHFLYPYSETSLGATETGTTTTNITITNHGLNTGDYIVNKTRNHETRQVTKIDANNVTVLATIGQTVGDNIYKITSHSDYMSDTLSSSILSYNSLLESKDKINDIAEIGTTPNNLRLTTHELVNGDYILNRTRNNEYRKIIKVDNDNVQFDGYVLGTYTSEDGTTETNVKITNHKLNTGDYIINSTRNNTKKQITVIDLNNFTVAQIVGQTAGDAIILEKHSIDNQNNNDVIYKYKDNTFRKLFFQKNDLQNELTILENDLTSLNNQQTLVLDNVSIQQENNTYTTYDFTYNGVLTTKTTSISNSNKYVVMCKVFDITNITVKLNNVTKTLSSNMWTILGKIANITSTSVETSGSATGINIKIVVCKISEDEYTTNGNESILIDKYCLDKIQILVTAKQSEITTKNTNITNKNTEIVNLKNQLSLTNNFTSNQLNELKQYNIEEEWSDDKLSDALDLYEVGIDEFTKRNMLQTIINISAVNFLECITEYKNWDKLNLGDTVKIVYEKTNIDVKARITELEFNHENNEINLIIANVQEILNDKDSILKKLYNSIHTTNNLNLNKDTWDINVVNFNLRNDRISAIPATPIIANDGTAIDHSSNTDGSCNISFEWQYNGITDEYNIDGFIVYVRSLTTNEPYIFGSSIAREQIYNINADKRAFILYGVPINQYYTFGVQAYRRVDADINSNGILKSNIAKSEYSLENPYLPSADVEFNGNVTGKINGVIVSIIADNSAPTIGTINEPTINNNGTITISWSGFEDTESDIGGYYVWRATDVIGSNKMIIGTTTQNITTFTDSTTEHNGDYYYYISCYDKNGNESQLPISGWKYGKASNTILPSAPTDLIIDGGWGRIDLLWTAPTDKDIEKYKILVCDNNLFAEETYTINYTNTTYWTDFNRITKDERYYRIYAIDYANNISSTYLSGNGSANVAADKIYPAIPTNGSVSSDSNGRLTLTYTGSTAKDALYYRIVRHTCTDVNKTNDDGGIEINIVPHIGTVEHKYLDGYLEKNKYYYYKVYCIDNSGMISTNALIIPGSGAQQAIDTTPPSTPTINLTKAKIGAIAIGWTEISDAKSYKIYRFDENGLNETFIGQTTQLQYIDNSMNTDTQTVYRYKVSAVDGWDNEGAKSTLCDSIVSLTPWTANDNTNPTEGTINTPAPNSDGSVTITWSGFTDSESDVGGYNVWRAKLTNLSDKMIIGTVSSKNINTFTDVNTKHNTEYYYWVTCFDNAGNETSTPELYTSWKYVLTNNTEKPALPATISAIARLGRMDIFWDSSTSNDVVGYRLIKSTDGINYSDLIKVNTNSYIEYNITASKNDIANWRYRVRSINSIGLESESWCTSSAPITTTYKSADNVAPASLPSWDVANTKSNYDGSITLKWTHTSPDSDLAKYRIYKSEDGTNYYNIAEVDKDTFMYIDTGLKNGQGYYYKLSAIDNSGMESDNKTSATNQLLATDQVAPTPPNPTATGDLGAIRLTWTEVSEKGVTYEIWRCLGGTWSDGSATKIATVAGSTSGNGGQGSYIDYDPPTATATTYTYKLKAVDVWGNISGFSTSSSSATSSIDFNGTVAGIAADSISKTPATFIIADGSTTQNTNRADYVVPANSTSAEDTINQAINALPKIVKENGTAQAGGTNTITLASTSSVTTDSYKYYFVEIISGTGSGQSKTIISYNGSTKVATIDSNWTIQPDVTSVYAIKSYSGKIILLEGIYIIDGDIIVPSFVSIEGQGLGTVIKVKDNIAVNVNAIRNSDIVNGNTNIEIKKISLDGNKGKRTSGDQFGVYWKYVVNSHLNTVEIYNFMNGGFQGDSIIHNFIMNNTIRNNGDSSITSHDEGIYICGISQDNIINNNICTYNNNSGILISGVDSGSQCLNNTVMGNICQYNGFHGIIITYAQKHTIVGNLCMLNDLTGITLVHSSYNSITSNVCSENSQASNNFKSNIQIDYDSDYNNIQNNVCRKGNQTNKPKYGIEIVLSDCDNNLVTNNDLYDSGVSGSFSDGGSSTVVSAGNRL